MRGTVVPRVTVGEGYCSYRIPEVLDALRVAGREDVADVADELGGLLGAVVFDLRKAGGSTTLTSSGHISTAHCA